MAQTKLHIKPVFFFTLLLALVLSCAPDRGVTLALQNPGDFERINETVLLKYQKIHGVHVELEEENTTILVNGNPAPFQFSEEGIYLVQDFMANERKTVRIITGQANSAESLQKVQAEISVKTGGYFEDRKYIGGSFTNVNRLEVPVEHTDHSNFIRYEGPGWESEKVGYRFYLDWRNAIDIFGKKDPALVLQKVGQDGFDSYHEMADWGMDILKVGESLGMGSLAMMSKNGVNRVDSTNGITCEITHNGPLLGEIKTDYSQWTVDGKHYDLTSILSITAGSRITKHSINISPVSENLVTGIAKHSDADLLDFKKEGSDWAYLATYGKQSLSGDNLGMAIFYKQKDLLSSGMDENNHYIELKPDDQGHLTYLFGAAWQGEQDGIVDKTGFKRYLNQVLSSLEQPINILY